MLASRAGGFDGRVIFGPVGPNCRAGLGVGRVRIFARLRLDGYPDHGSLRAFMMDRHRDYELTLSGYTVLRIANYEIAQDIAMAIEKIRDLVRLRRSQAMEG